MQLVLSHAVTTHSPPSHQIVSFFLGFVFISCIHYTIHLPLAAARRLRSFVLSRGRSHTAARRASGGLEVNRPLSDDKVHRWLGNRNASIPATSSSVQSRCKSNNLALSLTLCLGMASAANFGSLLLFNRHGLAGCGTILSIVHSILIPILSHASSLSCRVGWYGRTIGPPVGALEAQS